MEKPLTFFPEVYCYHLEVKQAQKRADTRQETKQ